MLSAMTLPFRRSVLAFLCAVAGMSGAWSLQASPLSAQGPAYAPVIHQAQVEARILWAPRIVQGSDGQRHLAYELRITSFQTDDAPLELVRIAVSSNKGTAPFATVEGAALDALLTQPAPEGTPRQDGVTIKSGQSKSFFFWLTPPHGELPSALRHQLTFRTGKSEIQRADNVSTPILQPAPIKIGPPLRGGRWMAVEGPGNHRSHHWGGLVAIDGKLTIPQRFAIDWFGLDDGNHSVRGAHDSLASTVDADWVGYGHDVLAVADGVVVDARDGSPNGTPLAPQETPDDLTARSLYGNFVILKIAPNTYAHYAHLQNGSVSARIGQRVQRGAVLGLLGQTGAAGAPHLHFHLSDRPTFEQSEGLPFLIDAFVLLGRGTIEDTFDPAKPVNLQGTQSAGLRRSELPLDGSVVTFPWLPRQ